MHAVPPGGPGDPVEQLVRSLIYLFVALALALDVATKAIVSAHIPPYGSMAVVPGLFNLVHAENPGIAFSFFVDENSAWRNPLLIAFSSAASLFLIWLLWSHQKAPALQRWAFALILAGALGNLLDRIRHGAVTDFIEVHWGPHYFPAFNVADSCITIGAFLLLLDVWRTRAPQTESHRVP